MSNLKRDLIEELELVTHLFIDEEYLLKFLDKYITKAQDEAYEKAAKVSEGAAVMSYGPHQHPEQIAKKIRELKSNE